MLNNNLLLRLKNKEGIIITIVKILFDQLTDFLGFSSVII